MDKVKVIEELINKRYSYLCIFHNSWNEKVNEYEVEEPEEIDLLSSKIWDLLREGRKDLSIDFIIESITKLGGSPCILYDDNGNFAVTGSGFSSVTGEVEDQEMSFFIEKERWFSTIRLALNYYLDEE